MTANYVKIRINIGCYSTKLRITTYDGTNSENQYYYHSISQYYNSLRILQLNIFGKTAPIATHYMSNFTI